MKVSIYSLTAADKTPHEVISLAKKYDCEGIEWWCRENGHIKRDNVENSAREIAKMMKDAGLEVVGLAPYFNGNEKREEIEDLFNSACILNTPIIRCHSYSYDGSISFWELLKKQRQWLEKVILPLTEEYKVKLVIEQHHNHIVPTPEACRMLVDGFPSERIGIIYDPGNSLMEGFTRPSLAIDIFGEYLSHVHVKSARSDQQGSIPEGKKTPLKFGSLEDGELDWEKIIHELHKSGYKGFLSLEALDDRPTETKLSEDIPYLKSILQKIEKK